MLAPRAIVAIALVAICAGCATRGAPTVQLEVQPEAPTPQLHQRDPQTGKALVHAVGGAAGGALTTVGYGCRAGGAVGCIVGVVLAPVGMIVGAGSGASRIKPLDSYEPVDRVASAASLLADVDTNELPAMLSWALVSSLRRERMRALLRDRREDGPLLHPTLRLRFSEINLSGELEDDPAVALKLEVHASLAFPYQRDIRLSRFSGRRSAERGRPCNWAEADYAYQGARRRLSEWRAHDGRLFREELTRGVESIAGDAVAGLRAQLSGCSTAVTVASNASS